jgi:hypothetical protein
MEGATHERDGGEHNLCGYPFTARVQNACGWQTWDGEHNGEAVCGDDCKREMGAIGDQTISQPPPHEGRIFGVSQDMYPIAVFLSEGDQMVGIEAGCLAKPRSVMEDAVAAVTASEPQIQRGIRRLAHTPKSSAEGVCDDPGLTHRVAGQKGYLLVGLERKRGHSIPPAWLLHGRGAKRIGTWVTTNGAIFGTTPSPQERHAFVTAAKRER